MKSFPTPRRVQLLIAALACYLTIGLSFASASPVPRGTLTVDRQFVRAGDYTRLAWDISYPSTISDLVEIRPPHSIKPNDDLRMQVRILGASFKITKSNNGHGNNEDGVDSSNPGQGSGGPNGAYDMSGGYDDEIKEHKNTRYLPVELLWARNGAAWNQLDYGTEKGIDPTQVVLDTDVKPTDSIEFGGRGWCKQWLPFYSTATSSPNVAVFKNGDSIASVTPYFQLPVENYLKPFISHDGTTITIGDNDLLILMELGNGQTQKRGFNLQDVGILVTFR